MHYLRNLLSIFAYKNDIIVIDTYIVLNIGKKSRLFQNIVLIMAYRTIKKHIIRCNQIFDAKNSRQTSLNAGGLLIPYVFYLKHSIQCIFYLMNSHPMHIIFNTKSIKYTFIQTKHHNHNWCSIPKSDHNMNPDSLP